MTAYDEGFTAFPGVSVAYPKPPKMDGVGGQVLSDAGLTQFRCAETEKFRTRPSSPTTTARSPSPAKRAVAQSPSVATYDLQPEMSAAEVTRLVLEQVQGEPGVLPARTSCWSTTPTATWWATPASSTRR